MTAPRFGTHHLVTSFNQKAPELASLSAYETIGQDTLEALKARGHRIRIDSPPFWYPSALSRDPATGLLRAAGDPKARRRARAY